MQRREVGGLLTHSSYGEEVHGVGASFLPSGKSRYVLLFSLGLAREYLSAHNKVAPKPFPPVNTTTSSIFDD